jgi:hypothetical protein
MPVKPKRTETEAEFISRCMSEEKDSFPDEKQRYAVCISFWEKELSTESKVLRKIKRIKKDE